MANSEYTKGEWELEQHGDNAMLVVCGDKTIARTSNGSTIDDLVEIIANANLIAAAPDLYEALKELNKLQKQGNIKIHGNSKVRDVIRQALSKAEGKDG